MLHGCCVLLSAGAEQLVQDFLQDFDWEICNTCHCAYTSRSEQPGCIEKSTGNGIRKKIQSVSDKEIF